LQTFFSILSLTMRYRSFILILLCLNSACSKHIENRHWFKRMVKCKSNWVYFKLENPIRGRVLSYAKGMCGYFEIASNIIIRTSAGGTIRVFELPCVIKGEIIKSDSVLVSPVGKPDSVGGLMDGKFDCIVRRTCIAHVAKIP